MKSVLIFYKIISMNRQIVSASRLVTFEQIKRNWLKHEDRLIHIKPTLNTRSHGLHPTTFRKCNYTKSLEIQLENKALLKKLTDRVDRRNDVSMCSTFSLPKSNRRKYYEDHKIKFQNEGLYKRLRETKPIIDTEKLETDRRNHEKYINTISKFGFKGLRPNKTFLKFDMKNNDLKYLSKRRILINSSEKEERTKNSSSRVSPMMTIEKEALKIKNNERLRQYFLKPRQITIDQEPVFLRIVVKPLHILLELKGSDDKENEKSSELEVKIDKNLFETKFRGSLDVLVNKLRYNSSEGMFYII